MAKKIYTVPLKVFLYFESFVGTSVNFKLENKNVFYTVELDVEYGIENNNIIGKNNNNKYLFDININVLCNGKDLKSIWKMWKENGEEIFNEWFINKKNVL